MAAMWYVTQSRINTRTHHDANVLLSPLCRFHASRNSFASCSLEVWASRPQMKACGLILNNGGALQTVWWVGFIEKKKRKKIKTLSFSSVLPSIFLYESKACELCITLGITKASSLRSWGIPTARGPGALVLLHTHQYRRLMLPCLHAPIRLMEELLNLNEQFPGRYVKCIVFDKTCLEQMACMKEWWVVATANVFDHRTQTGPVPM